MIDAIVRDSAARLGLSLPDQLPANLGRSRADLHQEILSLDGRTLDGYDGRTEAQPLVERFSRSEFTPSCRARRFS